MYLCPRHDSLVGESIEAAWVYKDTFWRRALTGSETDHTHIYIHAYIFIYLRTWIWYCSHFASLLLGRHYFSNVYFMSKTPKSVLHSLI